MKRILTILATLALLANAIVGGAVYAQSTNSGLTPVGVTQTMAVTGASSSITLNINPGNTVLVQNTGASTAFIKGGPSATTADFPILAGNSYLMNYPPGQVLSAITGSGTTTLRVSKGLGNTALSGAGSSGSPSNPTVVDIDQSVQGVTNNVTLDGAVDGAIRTDSATSAQTPPTITALPGGGINAVGMASMQFQAIANASVNTITFEGSADGGTTWSPISVIPASAVGSASSVASVAVVVNQTYVTAYVMPLMRWRVSSFLGGTTTIATALRRTQNPNVASVFVGNTALVTSNSAVVSSASLTRPANTTTYTPSTGWNNGTPTFLSFTAACRANSSISLITTINISSNNNPALKLSGILWLFKVTPGTNVVDNATFNIASADFANLTGSVQGFPFTLSSPQGAGAANSGTVLAGTAYQIQCSAGNTLVGMIEVTNAYIPASAEILTVSLGDIGVN